MVQAPSITRRLDSARREAGLLVVALAAVPRLDGVSPAAWIVGAGLMALEAYFFATLLRAWMKDRRARAVSKRRRGR